MISPKICCEMGTHECEVPMITFGTENRNRLVYIDRCLASEICALWNEGIETIACCCGHNVVDPTILVDKKYQSDMESLGYGPCIKDDIENCILWYKSKTPFCEPQEKSQEKHSI